MQLNTLLDAVRNMSPSSQNTIRFKLDGKLNEIQVNSNSDKDSQEGESTPYTKQSQATVSEKTYDLDPSVTGKELVPVGRHLELERPRGVDRSGIFDGGSLSPIMDELESTSEGKPYGSTADKDDRLTLETGQKHWFVLFVASRYVLIHVFLRQQRHLAGPRGTTVAVVDTADDVTGSNDSKSSAPHPTESVKRATIPSATVSTSNWSDPSFSIDLPPLVPQQHLTVAEKKKPQWARERAEFESCYDPWGRRSRNKTRHSVSRAGSILTDYPVMEDENKVLLKMQERSKWLAELEKQREEQRLQRFERLEADREAHQNSFIDKFSRDRKPVALPSQINIQKDRSVVTTMPSRHRTVNFQHN
ncbi:uncharacterized protein LOC124136105 [Haliotis rufescens]|uniref:uncharacterized protein LOC124136105 n=1 Tax=Haliotis rufescens TaxID=6454 RepID=UPI00201F55BC|nr:uncharacterized protein LOC124136105 [Haliotis rufescens]